MTAAMELTAEESALVRALSTRAGPWSEAEYFALPRTNLRIELLDGSLLVDGGVLVSSGASRSHQQFARRLADALEEVTPGDVEVCEAINVRLVPGRIVIPDVVVATYPGSDDSVTPAAETLLVAEVSSPSNAATDRTIKHELYADAGIPTYLRFDLTGPGAPAGVAYRLRGSGYVEVARAGSGGELELTEPFPVTLDLTALSRRPRLRVTAHCRFGGML